MVKASNHMLLSGLFNNEVNLSSKMVKPDNCTPATLEPFFVNFSDFAPVVAHFLDFSIFIRNNGNCPLPKFSVLKLVCRKPHEVSYVDVDVDCINPGKKCQFKGRVKILSGLTSLNF